MKKTIYKIVIVFIFCAFTIKAQNIYTYAGGGTSFNNGILATNAQLVNPSGVAVDDSLNVYFIDQGSYQIKKINYNGIINSIAGNGIKGSSGDGGSAILASIDPGFGIAVDDSGNVYFSEAWNYKIRKINTLGIISTYAGNGSKGFSGDGGSAITAQIDYIPSIAIDTNGNLYLADASRIRKINKTGTINTLISTGVIIQGIDVNDSGYVYYCYNTISSGFIKKVNSSGVVVQSFTMPVFSSYGGHGISFHSCYNGIRCIALENFSTIYSAYNSPWPWCNNGSWASEFILRTIPSGSTTLKAGTGSPGFAGDGGPAVSAMLNQSSGMAVDKLGNLFVSDLANNRIRLICSTGGMSITASKNPICQGDSAVLSITSAPNTPTWSTGSNSMSIIVKPNIYTTYTVGAGINASNPKCPYEGAISITVTCTDVKELDINNSRIQISPNPTSGEFTITNTKLKEGSVAEIYNSLGQTVMVKPLTEENTKIDLSKESTGMYFVRVNSESGWFTRKVVKE